jgi:hypothetical protein
MKGKVPAIFFSIPDFGPSISPSWEASSPNGLDGHPGSPLGTACPGKDLVSDEELLI